MITRANLEHWFQYHLPADEETRKKYVNIRTAAKTFAEVVLVNTPESADQSVAIRKVREAVLIANAAIACGGR